MEAMPSPIFCNRPASVRVTFGPDDLEWTTMYDNSATIHLNRGGTSVVMSVPEAGVPRVSYWGRALEKMSEDALRDFVSSQVPGVVSGVADIPPALSLVPLQSEGWIGTPGLSGSRGGRGAFSDFRVTAVRPRGADEQGAAAVEVDCLDDEADLALTVVLELTESGVLRARAELTNCGEDGYGLDSLMLALPVPASETQVLDQSGHHLRERDLHTHDFTVGTHERSVRVARGHAESTIHGTCEPNLRWRDGQVHYVHVAWSGNTRTIAEKDVLGFQTLMSGELLYPGEVILGSGQTYSSPWIVATWGNGLDEAAARIHAMVRSQDNYPTTPRPVTLNAWEAVYFDHSLPRLLGLVEAAAEVGVERFVLDDGWFSGRRDDTTSLGDWVVSEEMWPDGLDPLANAVHAAGMQFGLWVEPEMISPDSEAARAHPEWILSPEGHRPREARWQQVIDLANPDAFEHIRSQLVRVLSETDIDYLKWDFNRDLYEAVSPVTGRASYRRQTEAMYRLMDDLLERFPGLEIESCAGGGGRIDLEIMSRAVRIWASDCIDPLERKLIEAGTSLLLPPELVGSHVASTTSHTTGRTLNLTLRASTAMFSHMGVEWDLAEATAEERSELASWIALHKEKRELFHTGTVVRSDHPDKSWWIHGVVSDDASEAVFALTRMRTGAQRPTPPITLPGLDARGRYLVRELLPDGITSAAADAREEMQVPWWKEGLTLPGSVLGQVGIRCPDLEPERAVLLEVTRVSAE